MGFFVSISLISPLFVAAILNTLKQSQILRIAATKSGEIREIETKKPIVMSIINDLKNKHSTEQESHHVPSVPAPSDSSFLGTPHSSPQSSLPLHLQQSLTILSSTPISEHQPGNSFFSPLKQL
jgi:hypothetical protein